MLYSFNVGPSALWPETPVWISRILASGILSQSHRSSGFEELYRRIDAGFRRQHHLPEGYRVYLLSSATECWQILAETLVTHRSLHLYSGSFGERWFELTHAQHPLAEGLAFAPHTPPQLPLHCHSYDLVALTHNETSNGSALPIAFLSESRQWAAEALLAVDATSSMGGVHLPYAEADIWFASVQKCLGLPSGLAVMFASPRAQERIEAAPDSGRYHSLTRVHQRATLWQTTHTPNVLGIALLAEMLENTPSISVLASRVQERNASWTAFLAELPGLEFLVPDPSLRSATVLAIQTTVCSAQALREATYARGFLLASGYGAWKNTTLRIANFPAQSDAAIKGLREHLVAIVIQ